MYIHDSGDYLYLSFGLDGFTEGSKKWGKEIQPKPHLLAMTGKYVRTEEKKRTPARGGAGRRPLLLEVHKIMSLMYLFSSYVRR